VQDNINTITGKQLTLRQKAFFKTDEAKTAVTQLKRMVDDPIYNTRETYSSNAANTASFVDRHMIYLSEHPNLSVHHYLSNLRLKTKI
jgi:hypothetical protein